MLIIGGGGVRWIEGTEQVCAGVDQELQGLIENLEAAIRRRAVFPDGQDGGGGDRVKPMIADRRRRVRELYERGFTDKEIARLIPTSERTVSRDKRAMDLT